MKKFAFPFFLIVAFFTTGIISCKKDGAPKEILLAEVIDDGSIEYRFKYNAQNKISRIETFKKDPIDNSMLYYYAFTYDSKGVLTQFTSYDVPGDVPTAKVTLTHDSAGKLTGGSTYLLTSATPNVPAFNTSYKYNAKGLINNIQQKDKNGKLLLYTNLIYYDDGHLKSQENFGDNGGILWLKAKTSYSIPNGYYPSGLENLRTLLNPDFMASVYSESIQVYEYDQNGVVTYSRKDIMSGRQFNNDGTLSKQVISMNFYKPVKPEVVSVKEYNYISQ